MKHCPNERCPHYLGQGRASEFLDAVELCSDCGVRLQPGAAPEPAREEVGYHELVTIYETNDRIQAHLIASRLADAGIDAHVGGDALQGALGELPVTMLALKVQVSPEDAEPARAIALASEPGARRGLHALDPSDG